MVTYFVKEWNPPNQSGAELLIKIHCLYTLKELWVFLQEHRNVSVYEAECVLDWSG